MNYRKHYETLIETRKNRVLDQSTYYERHHIVMASHGGSDSPENIVNLTAREHFLAHWLLWKIHRDQKSAFAFSMMRRDRHSKRKNLSSREYAAIREALSFAMSQYDFSGEKNSQWGKSWSKDLREQLSSRKVGAFREKHGTSNPMWGKTHSEETKLQMCLSRKGKKKKPQTAEHRRKISESRKRGKEEREQSRA